MYFLLIFFLLYQNVVAHDALDINLKFFKNVTANYSFLAEIHEAVLNYRPIIIKHYDNDDDNVSINYELYDNVTKQALNTKIYSRLKYKYQAMLQKYETRAIKKATERLRNIPYYMLIELHIRKDKFPPMYIFIKDFTKKSHGFFKDLYKQNFSADIDKEFSLLDTAQSFNGLVYEEELALLNDMILKHNLTISTNQVMIISKHLYNEYIDNIRADIEYFCIKFDICRPRDRFSDNMSDIVRELLKLSDTKLTDILLKLSVYIKDQSKFFQMILGESSAMDIGMKLEELVFRDISGIRSIFVDLRSYLAMKHKFTKKSDEESNLKDKALRILVDIIDQAFDVSGDEILAMHFNIILKTISDWSEGRKNEIEFILKASVVQAVELMKNNLTDDAINEIKALVDVLMKKENRNNTIYRYLFNVGSTFVRGEDIPLKLSLLL